MSKKKHPSNERQSARGHVEGNVIRFQLKQELIRIGPDGKPIKGKLPINTFSKDWLSSHLLDPSVSGPPSIPRRDPPPDNVTSITKAKAKVSKPVSQSGNEAESVPEFVDRGKNTTPADKTKHGWLHNKWCASVEFDKWAANARKGKRPPGYELWVYDENRKKLSSPSLELQRERSRRGHAKAKSKIKGAPSLVDNPFLNKPESGGYDTGQSKAVSEHNKVLRGEKPLERKFWDMSAKHVAKSPSGLPISEFITGKYKSKNAVVYTTDTPQPPRDWDAAVNDQLYDNAVKVRKVPGIKSDHMRLAGVVEWYIRNVDVQKWPLPMYRFARFKPDQQPIVNHDAINEVAGDPERELAVFKAMNHGMQRQYRMIDIALGDVKSENNLLWQELELTKKELAQEKQDRLSLEYQLAQQTGDTVSLDEIRRDMENIVKPKTPKAVPDDVDTMLSEYKVYQSFVKVDGPERAFARYVYGDAELGTVIRDHADMLCQQRQSAVEHRNMVRFLRNLSDHILGEMQAEYEQQKCDSYVNFWKTAYPTYLRGRNRQPTAVRDPAREAVAYAAMSRKSKPATHRSSLYYSTLDNRSSYLTDAVAKHILSDVKPTRVRYNNPRLVEHDTRESWAQPAFKGISKYEQWWEQWFDYCELEYHKKAHPIRVGVVKTYNRLVDILNTPVDPATRSRHKQLREQMKLKQQELDEKRERRKEERAEAKQRKAEREHIRKMQRIAH